MKTAFTPFCHRSLTWSYAYHHLKKHGSTTILDGVIDGYGIEVVPFDVELAHLAAANALVKHDFSANATDYAIGAYAGS